MHSQNVSIVKVRVSHCLASSKLVRFNETIQYFTKAFTIGTQCKINVVTLTMLKIRKKMNYF